MDRLKWAALGERLKIGGEWLKSGGAEMGKKVSGKMKEILQVQSQEAKMVDEATSESLGEPNWGLNLRICALLNSDEFNGPEVVRAIKKKISGKNVASQRLSLDLLEACAMNCDKVFSEVASEKLLDEMVRMIDSPQTNSGNKRRAWQLIESWGKSSDLAYLPIFSQTYMSLKARKGQRALQDDTSSPMEQNGFDEHSAPSSEMYHFSNLDEQDPDPNAFSYEGGALSMEEKKEILVITRNSMEILASILNSETQPKPIMDDLTQSMLEKCKESQPMIQRIIESIGDDEPMLFEALSLHDELEQVLSKCEELVSADAQVPDDSGSPAVKKEDPADRKKVEEQNSSSSLVESSEAEADTKGIGRSA